MHKLRQQRGVSILIALLIFLLVALTGTAVLTMSASNAGRFVHAREDQQRYLSVASAVRLLKDELRPHAVTVTIDPAAPMAFGEDDGIEVVHRGSALFGKMDALSAHCKEKALSDMTGAQTVASPFSAHVTEFSLTVLPDGEDSGLSERIGKVDVRLEIDNETSNMVFTLWHSGTAGNNYRTRMTVRHIGYVGGGGGDDLYL